MLDRVMRRGSMDPIRASKGYYKKKKEKKEKKKKKKKEKKEGKKKGARLVASQAKGLIMSPPQSMIILFFLSFLFLSHNIQPASAVSFFLLPFFPLLPRVCFPSLELRSWFSDARLAEVDAASGREESENQPQLFHQSAAPSRDFTL